MNILNFTNKYSCTDGGNRRIYDCRYESDAFISKLAFYFFTFQHFSAFSGFCKKSQAKK